MDHAKYVGKRPDLLGRTALLRPKEGSNQEVLAQFDYPVDMPLRPDGAPTDPEAIPECFSWHLFPVTDFVITDEIHDVRPL